MFCCSTESVEQFKNLDGFPMNVLISRALLQKQKNKIEMEATSANYNEINYEDFIGNDEDDDDDENSDDGDE